MRSTTRARVLTALLQGPVFHPEQARARWEDRARQNLADEIRLLTGSH